MIFCTVRPDLINAGLFIPVGNKFIEKGEYICRWEYDESFQIFLDGEWLVANSIDFEFKN